MDHSRITLRIQHPARLATVLCAALPFPPERTWDVGACRTDRTGMLLPDHNAETSCSFPLAKGAGRPPKLSRLQSNR